MTFTIPDGAASLHAAVHSVMREAADRAILPRHRRLAADDVREKVADELVTIADKESESILAEGLGKIFPEAAIVGEEAVDADPTLLAHLGESLCWIIDPLDGTANFVAGEGPFGILVALAEHGVPIGGWILDPRSGRFVVALRGRGTFIDGEPVTARESGNAVPIAAISPLFANAPGRRRIVEQLRLRFEAVPIPRCAAEQYPAMILGKSDIALFERTFPWDHAAGVLCLVEAGGQASRLDGSAYRVDDQQTGLIAAVTPALAIRFRKYCGEAVRAAANPG